MIAQLRAELLKQRTTRTLLGLSAGLLGLVVLAVLLHAYGFRIADLGRRDVQLMLLGRGEFLGVLFAALLGALSITAEVRHGTIRPTFLVTPRRTRVVAAKVAVSAAIGALLGLVAGLAAWGASVGSLAGRGVVLRLDGGDQLQLIVGAGVAAGLWAAIGVGIGALIRGQVPALVGICAWLLFVEGLLADTTGGLGVVGRVLPGAAAQAISGQWPDRLLTAAGGLAVLLAYAVVAAVVAALATLRRDVG